MLQCEPSPHPVRCDSERFVVALVVQSIFAFPILAAGGFGCRHAVPGQTIDLSVALPTASAGLGRKRHSPENRGGRGGLTRASRHTSEKMYFVFVNEDFGTLEDGVF